MSHKRCQPAQKRLRWVLAAGVFLATLLAIGPRFLVATGQESAASGPALGPDDITLLLIGGASESKLIPLIEKRGIAFRMTPQLAKRFHDLGASDHLIDVLSRSGEKAKLAATPAPAAAPSIASGSSGPPASVTPPPSASPAAAGPTQAPSGHNPAASSAEQSVPVQGGTQAKVQQIVRNLNPPVLPRPIGPAPAFTLSTIAGNTFDFGQQKDKVVLVDFWSTTSDQCRHEIPGFMDLAKRYKSQGLRVVGINLNDKLSTLQNFYDRYDMDYPVGVGNARLKALFGGIVTVPTVFLIGRDGLIYYKVEGSVPEASIEGRIQTLLTSTGSAAHRTMVAKAAVADGGEASGEVIPVKTASVVSEKPAPPSNSTVALPDPSPARIQEIIQAFTTKEKLFKEARENYTWHQINKVETLDADGNVTGSYEQDWDILFDGNGKRIERVTYAPEDTLAQGGLQITEQDIESFRNVQPFVMTSDDLPEYEVKYLGHVHVDYITAYVFSVRPKEIKKGKQYFKGVIWVDDHDLQIVKAEGKPVPEIKTKGGQNLFPRFTTWRQQIDGKYWFPTFTMADDTLYFDQGPIRIKEIIKYTDYKQFKSKIRILSTTPISDPAVNAPPTKH